METPKPIPIQRAKDLAALGYDEVIIVGANYETGVQHVTTYGKSLAACKNAAKGGNAIKKLLGWPPEKCEDKPVRQENREKMDKLAKLLKWSDKYEINIQFWPKQTAVFIEKDGVELTDFGGDFDFAIDKAIEYLRKINKEN